MPIDFGVIQTSTFVKDNDGDNTKNNNAYNVMSHVQVFLSSPPYRHFKTVWPCIVIYSLWTKRTDALSSSFIGITTLHVSGIISARHQEFLAVYRHWYNLRSFVTECYQAHAALNQCTVWQLTDYDNTRYWTHTILVPPEDEHIDARNMLRSVM